MNKTTRKCLIWLGLLAAPAIVIGEAITVASFTPADLEEWGTHVFSRPTHYSLLEQNHGDDVLVAQCNNSASALVLRQKIDLRQTPYLSWSWQIQDVFEGLDETQKSGDDYVARVYVVIDGGLMRWKGRAINYVWSSSHPRDSTWPNPYAPKQVQMVAVRSGKPNEGGMLREVRNVQDDFKTLFDMDVDSIDAVAIMTDCDNNEATATAWYGDLSFEPVRQARAD